jgi:hypothetical protein
MHRMHICCISESSMVVKVTTLHCKCTPRTTGIGNELPHCIGVHICFLLCTILYAVYMSHTLCARLHRFQKIKCSPVSMCTPVALSGYSELQREHYITPKAGASYQTVVETKSSLSKKMDHLQVELTNKDSNTVALCCHACLRLLKG